MEKGTVFMIIGLFFAVLLSLINMNFDIGCPVVWTKIIWFTNLFVTAVMIAVFMYGVHLNFSSTKTAKRKRRRS
jgi:hypothetical protein